MNALQELQNGSYKKISPLSKCFHSSIRLTAVTAISLQTSDLLKCCELANGMILELQQELKDIFSQVLVTRYQCTVKDKSLCDTLQPTGLDVVFSVKNVSCIFN